MAERGGSPAASDAWFGLPHAALTQAVSEPNAKLSIEGGDDAGALGAGTGTGTLPLGNDLDGIGERRGFTQRGGCRRSSR